MASMQGSARALLTAVAAASLCCTAPEHDPELEDARPQEVAPSYAVLAKSAEANIAAGHPRLAIEDLMAAAEHASELDNGGWSYCRFGESTITIARQFSAAEFHGEAAMAFAIAVRFAQDCPELDRDELYSQRSIAQERSLPWQPATNLHNFDD